MTLTKGDHLLIKRNGKILADEGGEAYVEFEVINQPRGAQIKDTDGSLVYVYVISAKVVK